LFWAGCLTVASVHAGIDDAILRFSTPGPDHYADNRLVADGECYALVWSPAGESFAGFNADGTPANESDRLILAAPLAKGGRCPETIFQVPAATYAELSGGEWSVCLVDTRDARGVPAGVVGGIPKRINRWGVVESGVTLESAIAATAQAAAATVRKGPRRRIRTGTVSAVPADLESPKITAIDFVDGKVVLEVDGTVPYLTYTISSGKTLQEMQADTSAEVVDGGGAIEIKAGEKDSCRFFKVIRAE
ncbi:MAG: hypothetical protein J6P80_00535, partial [Kiritimatiellae bacterium]|nr:hypothetical protein [Kiritimatiellia bacterium]